MYTGMRVVAPPRGVLSLTLCIMVANDLLENFEECGCQVIAYIDYAADYIDHSGGVPNIEGTERKASGVLTSAEEMSLCYEK